MKWQRALRIVIALAAIAFAVFVATNMKQRSAPVAQPPVPAADPSAVVESQGGNSVRVSGTRQEGTLAYDRLLTYASGVSKMMGVTITSERNGKTFVIKAKEGELGANDSAVQLTGDVRMDVSDGLVLTAQAATYVKAENVIRVPGDATFTRARMTGSGRGLDYDQTHDVLRIAENATLDVAPDEGGNGTMSMRSATLDFNRVDKIVHLDRDVQISRDKQSVSADQAVAHLSADEEHLDLLELRGNSKVGGTPAASGGLESLTGRDMDLHYGGESSVLQRAVINGMPFCVSPANRRSRAAPSPRRQ
ncbi:MAG: LPS export ABC transporter periplasmic protein LptC [Vicinamibacterales bacterium]